MISPTRAWIALGLLAVCASVAGGRAQAAPLAAQANLVSVKSGSDETTLGDLLADAVRSTGGADFALVAANELKPVTLSSAGLASEQLSGALRAAQDAGDTVVVLSLTGAQVRAALERGVSHAPGNFAGFLQVSGLRVAYDAAKPQGNRVLTIVRPDGSPLAPGQTYTVATTRLLADGALGYFEVWPKDASARNTSVSLSKSLETFALAHQPLSYHLDGRISAK